MHCNGGMDVVSACGAASVSDNTYHGWRTKYGVMNRARVSELKSLVKRTSG